jgi:hypothetical protein
VVTAFWNILSKRNMSFNFAIVFVHVVFDGTEVKVKVEGNICLCLTKYQPRRRIGGVEE